MIRRSSTIEGLLNEAIAQRGKKRVKTALQSLVLESQANILTIIANQGSHKIPAEYLRGEIFVASRGNLDFSSASAIRRQFVAILKKLRGKLQEKHWAIIYLIPTGHPALSIHLKLGVYRISRINTIDIFYYNGRYFDLDIDVRNVDGRATKNHPNK
jgi:hypothetical protein